jgi:hypothetical protein
MKQLIDEFERGGEKLRQAVQGLTDAEFNALPVAGTWSIQQIVIHIQDSDLVGVDRMKRIIAEENPLLIGFNETLFARKLRYEDQSIADAIATVDLARRQFARTLRTLGPEAFERSAIHNEVGRVTLGEQLEKYNHHLEHHLGFIRKKRALLGK